MELSIAVACDSFFELAEWEGAKLLNTNNSDIVDTTLGSLVGEVVVDLAAAKEYLADLIISDKLRVLLTNDVSETQASFELFDLGLSTAVLE